jgi:membrane protein DedA with SNARE-associated domain
MNVNHLISHYGYAALFVLVALESLGIPLPGESILIAAGTYAGRTHKLEVWLVFAVAAAAAILGDNVGYWIGDKGGYRLLCKYGKYIRIREPELKVGRYVFDRHGGSVVFFGRFVSILRTYAAFLAGTNRMAWRRFVVFNAAGGIVWSAIYAFLSYTVGNSLKHASSQVNLILLVVAAVALVLAFFAVRRHGKRLEARAEAAYPGPLAEYDARGAR